ncbi:MAG: radical SAM protein [Planctomycetes bacterium]|nr:radical SAM protein [Planctomycetota bacterium]
MIEQPRYLELFESGELARRRQALYAKLSSCNTCPRACGVDRFARPNGFCRSGEQPRVAQAKPHFGEEPCLIGTQGSGTVFFSNCTGRCAFCQNYEISQQGVGEDWPVERLADAYLDLQARGCHNINLVTPTHYVAGIVHALELAIPRGLRIPFVYNTNGYDSAETLKLLDGIVDIYLPDFKYGDDKNGLRYSAFGKLDPSTGKIRAGYFESARRAIGEMYRQVGNIKIGEDGLAYRGVLVRHLIMPNNVGGTRRVLEELAAISPFMSVSLMAQYYPTNKAARIPEISRGISRAEYEDAVACMGKLGLDAGYVQELSPAFGSGEDFCVPDWRDPKWATPAASAQYTV